MLANRSFIPRSDCKFSPLAFTHILIKKLQEFGVREIQLSTLTQLINLSILITCLLDYVWII